MELRNLSKLQIRAEVLFVLQQLNSLDDMSKEQQDKYLARFRSIKDINHVVDVLIKELAHADSKKIQIISFFIQELGELDLVKDVLWSYIKSPKSSDELKDICGVILKNLGDQTDPEEFLNYLEDPKAIVDKETQKLLEIASINPEAQIDFLDFLYSLPEYEQINLVSSLKADYSSEHLVNVTIPALEANPSPKLEEELIRILGETRSPLAVPTLNDILKYSKNDITKKLAQKSLNMLKLAGVNVSQESMLPTPALITKTSDIYECHTNIVDGIGNQGIIISRIKPNHDILMLNVIINDTHGILDCFGFYGISIQDFARIIEKFQENTTRITVSPEYCKYKLEKAEKINKKNNLPIPYEYAAWKSLISDVKPLEDNFEKLCKSWASEDLVSQSDILYKFPDFKHWFFEDEDHPLINQIILKLIKELTEKKDIFIKNHYELKNWIELNIDKFLTQIFDDETRNNHKNRLLDIAYLLDIQNLQLFRNIAASLACHIMPENSYDINKSPFFRDIIKRTFIEGFIRHQYKIEQEITSKSSPDNDLNEVINILCNM